MATVATCDLCNIMLKDSAYIQEMEAEWKSRKNRRAGKPEVDPLYTTEDAAGVLGLFTGCSYKTVIEVAEQIKIRFIDAGHLLGSASIEVWIREGGVRKKIVFSGDIGNQDKPLIRNPDYIREADYVVMESTYGNRMHKKGIDHLSQLVRIVKETLDRGGNVVIPAFAVGRTQELLYYFRQIKTGNMLDGHEAFEVYVDSPLAAEATEVFKANMTGCFDEETKVLVKQGINPITFPGLKLSVTNEDSKRINFDTVPKVIISASGMCDAGRIRHHLKHNLWRPECSVIFAGYQAQGTLGRSLLDGNRTVKLFGETIEVHAHIEVLEDISGHADQEGLLNWAKAYEKKPEQIFLVHGDDEVFEPFSDLLRKETGCPVKAPYSGSQYDLAAGTWILETGGILVEKRKEETRRTSTVYARLVAAGERLMQMILRKNGGANKDLVKLTNQINALIDKWDK